MVSHPSKKGQSSTGGVPLDSHDSPGFSLFRGVLGSFPTALDEYWHPAPWISRTPVDGALLLMVQKSGGHQLRLAVYPIIYKVLYIPSG